MFVPGTRRDFLHHLLVERRIVPDYFVVDFEDAVRDTDDAVNESSLKWSARETFASFFPLAADVLPRYHLRINAIGESSYPADLDFLWRTRTQLPAAIIQPKVASAADIHTLATALEALEGRGSQRVAIIPLIECAAGVANVTEIAAASPRIAALCFGHIDYFFERRQFPIPRSITEHADLPAAMQPLILTAAAHNIPYIDGGFYYQGHDDALRRHCAWIAWVAAGRIPLGKLVMHPDQVAILRNCPIAPPAADPLAGHTFAPPPDSTTLRRLAEQIVQAYVNRRDPQSSVCRVDDQIIPPQMYLLARAYLAA